MICAHRHTLVRMRITKPHCARARRLWWSEKKTGSMTHVTHEHSFSLSYSEYTSSYTCALAWQLHITFCSTMRGRIKGTDSTINAILQTAVLYI